MLVVDASVAVAACFGAGGLEPLPDRELVAPALMWSEARSSIHEALWRGAVNAELGERALTRLDGLRIDRHDHDRIGHEAWELAERLGWAKTYDAEYLALARLLECRVVTVDLRLRRRVGDLGLAVTPAELES